MKKSGIIVAILISLLTLSSCTAAPTPGETTTKAASTMVSTTANATEATTAVEAITTEPTTAEAITTEPTTAEVITTEPTTAEVTTSQGAAELGKPITIGDYEVTVQKVVTSKDYEGKDAITVVYDWTNNSENTVAPIFAVSFTVFQDGKELEMAILMDGKSADSISEVRPAISVEGLGSSFISTSKNELEIEVGELISFGEPVLLKVPFPQE